MGSQVEQVLAKGGIERLFVWCRVFGVVNVRGGRFMEARVEKLGLDFVCA